MLNKISLKQKLFCEKFKCASFELGVQYCIFKLRYEPKKCKCNVAIRYKESLEIDVKKALDSRNLLALHFGFFALIAQRVWSDATPSETTI